MTVGRLKKTPAARKEIHWTTWTTRTTRTVKGKNVDRNDRRAPFVGLRSVPRNPIESMMMIADEGEEGISSLGHRRVCCMHLALMIQSDRFYVFHYPIYTHTRTHIFSAVISTIWSFFFLFWFIFYLLIVAIPSRFSWCCWLRLASSIRPLPFRLDLYSPYLIIPDVFSLFLLTRWIIWQVEKRGVLLLLYSWRNRK